MLTAERETRLHTGGYDSEERQEYLAAVERLKSACGLPIAQPKALRDSLLDATFETDFARAVDSELLARWPLGEQLRFFRAIENLPAPQKAVRIHAQVYALYREKYPAKISSL